MTTRAWDESPQTWARLGGLFYLVIIVFALFGEIYVRGKLIVRGDAAATAANVVGCEALFRVGTAGEVLTLFPWSILPAFPAELGLALWLLFKGVDVPKWEASATVAAEAST